MTWLYAAGRAEAQIGEFLKDLSVKLAPLNPVLVWLDGDVATLLERAVAERGQQWLKEIIADVDTYGNVPSRPVKGFEEVVGFFNGIRGVQARLLSDGVFELWRLDVADKPVSEVKDRLRRLVLAACGEVGSQ